MSRPLTYGDFYATGIQDCQNVIDYSEHKDAWIALGRPSDPEASVNIVRHTWGNDSEAREAWLDQNDDFEKLDPDHCYESWRDGWIATAQRYVARWMREWNAERWSGITCDHCSKPRTGDTDECGSEGSGICEGYARELDTALLARLRTARDEIEALPMPERDLVRLDGLNDRIARLVSQIGEACNGCDQSRETTRYNVTYHSGTSETVRYCDDCAALARMDWNGETRSIGGQ